MELTKNIITSSSSVETETNQQADCFAQIGKLTIGALTAIAILFLIHLSNH